MKKVPLPPEERVARRAAKRFRSWLEKNPDAPLELQVRKLDEISDQEYDEEFLRTTVGVS